MKKFIIGGIAAAAIIVAAVLNMSISTKGDTFSDTFLANVEALAENESFTITCSGYPVPVVCFWINDQPFPSGFALSWGR